MHLKREERIITSHTLMPHYQVYYWTSLEEHIPVSVSGGPWWYRWFPRADQGLDAESVYEHLRRLMGAKTRWNATRIDQFVAKYSYHSQNREITFAIDAHDGKEIFSPELLESCDLYFKANKWKDERYDEKVRPLVNGNGFLRMRHLNRLKSMRGREKDNDFLFISRIWGGVEHNVRLFEELSSLQCRKRLVAIFVKGTADADETAAAISRLESVGVHCTYDLLSIKDLWQEIATSRIIMIRAGKYMCIPWRMIDLLCMGTCIVSDSDFEPEWPTPLVAGVHYESAGIDRPSDTSAAPLKQYGQITDKICRLLSDDTNINMLQKNAADYFDNFAAPDKVGRYILDTLREQVA
jgi:hypothetical protein